MPQNPNIIIGNGTKTYFDGTENLRTSADESVKKLPRPQGGTRT